MKGEKSISLYLEWFLILLFSGIISLLFFISSRFVIEQQIDKYHENRNLIRNYNEKYISQLQKYIIEQAVSSKDFNKLDKWVNDKKLIYIQIKKNNEWIYFSDFSMDEIQSEDYDFFPASSDNYYNINFSDGTAQVFIMGMYSYNSYMIALIFNIIISFVLFLILTILGIRKKILYINQLSQDIEILEGGNLEYDVHVEGNDEIATLAKGLNMMKISFKNQIQQVECLTKANQEMITKISHDLRTPLTSVLLYTEILQNEKYEDKEHRQEYLDKIVKKVQYMKDLSDRILKYSTYSLEERYIPTKYISLYSALYDELSDMCYYLEKQGLKIKTNLRWKKGQIYIYEEYLIRILDNIASNILKYTDKQKIVLIWDEYFIDEMCITFENTCRSKINNTDSHNIGIQNIKMMIKEMNGSCEVIQNEEIFHICLKFRYKNN